jgi:L-iditol 2-dehydrogenase
MKASVLYGVNDLRLEEIPVPKPKPDEVLVKISVAGVCGTDVHMWSGTNFEGTFPFVPGHEWVGEVVEAGPLVKILKVGDRVTGECFIPCHSCTVCRNGGISAFCPNHRYYGFQPEYSGGFAEYHVSPEERLPKIPDTMSNDEAVLIEPISVAYHAVWGRGGGVAPHDRVGIIGAGPIGLFAMQIVQASGAQVIVVEPAEYRKKMAKGMGAEVIVDPSKENTTERIMELTEGLGLSLIIECSGSKEGITNTVEIIGIDGKIVLTGQSMGLKPPAELGQLIWKHATITGSCDSPDFTLKTLAYLSRKLNDPTKIITHRFTLDKIQEAFELGNKGTGSGKIVIDF